MKPKITYNLKLNSKCISRPLEKDDYISGVEYYGSRIRRIKGWINKIYNREGKIELIEIQCDDEYKGARGTMIFVKLGNVYRLKNKDRLTKKS